MGCDELKNWFSRVRSETLLLCESLEPEDFHLQGMDDVSPPKWHIGHTSWFFDIFVLKNFEKKWKPVDPNYEYIFNSYYEVLGTPYPRPNRGQIARPLLKDIYRYQSEVTYRLLELIDQISSKESCWSDVRDLIITGLHHERQHQELLMMDIKYNRSIQPIASRFALSPDLEFDSEPGQNQSDADRLYLFDGGLKSFGCDASEEFSYDNERPKHNQWLNPFALSAQPVSNKEYSEFIEDSGYSSPKWWTSEGWEWVSRNQITGPLYWRRESRFGFSEFDMFEYTPLKLNAPVSHLSWFEAEAFSKWAGKRLPTEFELDMALIEYPELTRRLWYWTGSAYRPFPGFKPWSGQLSEYNGKFMVNQFVLKGGSFMTHPDHFRPAYRNFFGTTNRWQFSGLLLAEDVKS